MRTGRRRIAHVTGLESLGEPRDGGADRDGVEGSGPAAYRGRMWMVELGFEPAPERLAARPAHRELLSELHAAGTVRMAGPFADDSGAVIVLDTADPREVLANDPYFTTPGVTVVSVREWRPFLT
ncbi:YciI family protein [Actinoplanes oblitus]|uniref:YciI family protein n=1 Tax=Actinoplanes oblitus TaxID=3040509 RepID=A0ABY8W5G7_9ACTN|nr:YciI family protein [Actinoplanes oblitus]WIM92582.1 YciI family protein [Actinoplanes oblitus]